MCRCLLTILFFLTGATKIVAQYAPQVPLPGHDAIAKEDSRFVDWASGCSLLPGWINIADKSLGRVSPDNADEISGPPGIELLSLGDSGVAVLTFTYSIKNGPGPDFAVFENAFTQMGNDTLAFLELAFVEVSSDGENYVRFPASSFMQDSLQLDNFSFSDARLYHNLAGKYLTGYGTPFDLEELKNAEGLDVHNITHVRIVDVVGSIDPQYGSFDNDNKIINDPFPTPFASSGFDLNAVGVLNSNKPPTSLPATTLPTAITLYPNPTDDYLYVHLAQQQQCQYTLYDFSGALLQQGLLNDNMAISLKQYPAGIYVLRLISEVHTGTIQVIKK